MSKTLGIVKSTVWVIGQHNNYGDIISHMITGKDSKIHLAKSSTRNSKYKMRATGLKK